MNNFTKEELQIIFYMIEESSSYARHLTKVMSVKNKLYDLLNGDTDWDGDDE